MKRINWHSLKRQRGVTVIETAFALPIVIMVILLIFESGRLIFAYNTVAHAASEGVRYAVVRSDESELDNSAEHISQYVKERVQYLSGIQVAVEWPLVEADDVEDDVEDKSIGQTVTVTTHYVFKSTIPLIPGMTLSNRASGIIQY